MNSQSLSQRKMTSLSSSSQLLQPLPPDASLFLPKPSLSDRVISETSATSSIDFGWSDTLLLGRNVSDNTTDMEYNSRIRHSHKVKENTEKEDDHHNTCEREDGEEGEDECDASTLSHLDIYDGDDDKENETSEEGDTAKSSHSPLHSSSSKLRDHLIFWRPDFLFDLSKVNNQYCKSCHPCPNQPADKDCGHNFKNSSSSFGSSRKNLPPVSICEINARFTINGFGMSAFGTDAACSMLHGGIGRKKKEKKSSSSSSSWEDLHLAPVHRLSVMKEEIQRRVHNFSPSTTTKTATTNTTTSASNKSSMPYSFPASSPDHCTSPPTIWLVKGREYGYDCHSMEELLGVKPNSIKHVTPDELTGLCNESFVGLASSQQQTKVGNRVKKYNEGKDDKICSSCLCCVQHSTSPSHCSTGQNTSPSIHLPNKLLIFLELHQDELLKIPTSTMSYLTGSVTAIKKCSCRSTVQIKTCNPLSAVFLLHDKRTLGLLSDFSALSRIIGRKAASVVANTVVKTVPVSDCVRFTLVRDHPSVRPIIKDILNCDYIAGEDTGNDIFASIKPPTWMIECLLEAVHNRGNFVLKKSSSGKGEGMIYGQTSSHQKWIEVLFGSSSGCYVLQPLVDQSTFPVVLNSTDAIADITASQAHFDHGARSGDCSHNSNEDNLSSIDVKERGGKTCNSQICNVVGCLPFLSDVSFGPGIFRAAPAGPQPVSVAAGGAILLPALFMGDAAFSKSAPRWLVRSATSFCASVPSSSVSAPVNEVGNDDEINASLSSIRSWCPSWGACEDCAISDVSQAIKDKPVLHNKENHSFSKSSVVYQRDNARALLFYSGISVLASRTPNLLTCTAFLRPRICSDSDNTWILVSVPPQVHDLSEVKATLQKYGTCVFRLNGPSNSAIKENTHLLSDGSVSVFRSGGKDFFDSSGNISDLVMNEALISTIKEVGGSIHMHFPTGSVSSTDHIFKSESPAVWDITPRGHTSARSHNDMPFPMHTDASFESHPPSHFALHTISQDVYGGGLSQVLSGNMLHRVLRPEMRQILSRPIFTFHVPNEFRGNDESPKSVTQSILMSNLTHGPKLWRFRADIICGDDDGKHCPKGMCEVKHLQKLLRNPSLSIRLRLCPGTILFMDNGSYLHARSNIQDSSRWLKRVRFYMEGGR